MKTRRFRNWKNAVPSRVKLVRLLGYPSKLKKLIGDPRARAGTFFECLQELSSRYESIPNLTAAEYRVFSQNGEDGVIAEIVRRVGKDFPSTFVEFGGGNGLTGNTTFLADVLGWTGLFIEPATDDFNRLERKYRANPRVRTVQSFVSPENINELVSASAFPEGLGVLSIDVDGNDYYVWEALYIQPALIIVEYNGAIPVDEVLVQPYWTEPWDGTDYYGASLAALEQLGKRAGYVLVHTELTGTNAFFVREDLSAPFAGIEPPRRIVNQEMLGLVHPKDTKGRSYTTPARR